MKAEYAAESPSDHVRPPVCIDWSPEDQAFIASFPDIPHVRTHGATRDEAAERGEALIVTWLTALKDAGYPITPPRTRV